MSTPVLGLSCADEVRVDIDLERLIETRMLIQANSGAGKSWAIRRILEQTHGKVQQIVLDIEDEFHTLREKFDYVLASASGGDCTISVKNAAVLARRLQELGVSAVVGMHELKAHERTAFVRKFLDSLIAAPKNLWHPVLVVIDEAHQFAPQIGQSESASAVIDLMTRGRKRGIAGVLATQRLSKLHKDCAAEGLNKLIGRAALDVDMKRAADELGFSWKDQQHELRRLPAGEFFAFGPAISDTVVRVKIGHVQTTHPKIGQRSAPIPPPKGKVKEILSKLADLSPVAESTLAPVPAHQLAKLQTEVGKLRNDNLRLAEENSGLKHRLIQEGKYARQFLMSKTEIEILLQSALKTLREGTITSLPKMDATPIVKPAPQKLAADLPPKIQAQRLDSTPGAAQEVRGGALRMLMALAKSYPAKFTEAQWGTLSIMKHTGGSFSTYKSRLKSLGYLEFSGELVMASKEGLAAAGVEAPNPQEPEEVLQMWMAAIGGKPAMMLKLLHDTGGMTKSDLAEAVEMDSGGGSFSTYLGKIRANGLISRTGDVWSLTEKATKLS